MFNVIDDLQFYWLFVSIIVLLVPDCRGPLLKMGHLKASVS